MNEYIVTCKSYEDLENFYDDMETPGGSLYIPNRSVDLVHRRAISRNTHYMLTEEEAAEIRKDERVISCERPAKDRGIEIVPYWTQTGNFSKEWGAFDEDDKNWGLYRMVEGESPSTWGSDHIVASFRVLSNQTISTTASGKNVDVVIVDDHILSDHPEFAVNVDGTGGSRVNQFNWFQYSSALGVTTPETYTYTFTGNHGTHVAGTACGNTQGWARDANIYHMSFLDSGSGVTDWAEKLWDYLRYFHNNKAINSETGRRNPTIVNNSWGSSYGSNMPTSVVNSSTYRGTTTSLSGLTAAQRKTILEGHECSVNVNTFRGRIPAQNSAILADATDAMDDGVILVAAAGNSYWNCEEVGGADFNNYLSVSFQTDDIYHNRGSAPGDTPGIICVGNIDSDKIEHKRNSSNWGGRVDIWAPGSDIISSIYTNTDDTMGYGSLIQDPRDSDYYLASISGTSMASPQITGILACLLEQEPNLTPAEALQHLIENALSDVYDTGVAANLSPYEGLGDSNNRYAFIPKKRSDTGMASPAVLHKNRNTTTAGVKYPRVRNNRTTK